MSDKPQSSLEKAIQTAIATSLKELHTCLPAVVTKVNAAEQLIDAQITIKRNMGGELVNLPLLVNVPVRYYRSATFSITFPIEVGDHVMIIFAERSIDVWLTEGGIQNPFDVRRHDLSDAFAIPAMYPQTDLIPSFNANDLEIKTNSGDTKIIVNASEGVKIITTAPVDVEASEVNVTTTGDINATAGGNLAVECVDAEVIASGDALVDAGGDATVKGAVKAIIDAPAIELKSGGTKGLARIGDSTTIDGTHPHDHLILTGSTVVKTV